MKASKKIAIDCRSAINPHTGIGMYINGLVSHLRNKKNKYFLVCYEGFTVKNLHGLQFEYIRVKKTNKHIENQIVIPYEIYKRKFDLYHVTHHDVFPLLYFKKTIVSVMDIFWIDYKNDSSPLFKLLYYLITISSIKRANKVITISMSTKKSIEKKFKLSPRKAESILISCDDGYVKTKKSKNLKELNPYILYVGSAAKRKNIEIFEFVDNELKKLGHTINFILITKKTGKSDLELSYFYEKDNFIVDHNDYSVKELSEFYSNCLVFIFPSFYEGFGLPALEAIKCGAIPIVSNCTSLPEIVNNKELIVSPNDFETISNKIIKLTDNQEYRNKILNELSVVSKSFNWDITSKKTELLYEI
tara:strand:+ start:1895 stop:2974 length:1080 start_codon:yes stop_codon:yes gene_type:complete